MSGAYQKQKFARARMFQFRHHSPKSEKFLRKEKATDLEDADSYQNLKMKGY